jgi:hypothetical protein
MAWSWWSTAAPQRSSERHRDFADKDVAPRTAATSAEGVPAFLSPVIRCGRPVIRVIAQPPLGIPTRTGGRTDQVSQTTSNKGHKE